PGEWERTPKTGDGGAPGTRRASPVAAAWWGGLELGLAVFFAGVAAVAIAESRYRLLPFLALLVAGFAAVGLTTLVARRSARPAGNGESTAGAGSSGDPSATVA